MGRGRPCPANARHTARSRSIHSGVQRTLASLGGALAGRDGFCDCAQNDEVCAQRALREWRAGDGAGRERGRWDGGTGRRGRWDGGRQRGRVRPRPANARHTARSRSIHSGVQRTLASLGGALAGRDGFCDCAQNDEVCAQRALREWRAGRERGRWDDGTMGRGGGGDGTGDGGGDAYALALPTPVILREVAVSIVECKGPWLL